MSTLQAGITLRPDYSKIISATGSTNIASVSVANRGTKYFSDICTTLIDIQWRWNLLLFFGGFTVTWIAFACFYILLTYVHGDMFEQDEDWLPCVENVHDFASAFLFSIETMTTIGYGYRYVTEACPGAYLGVIMQSVLGAALQFALAGLVVAKVRRAKKRCTTILFSKVACIYAEDLKLRLAIRVGDMRKSDIIGAHARAYFIRKTVSKTGDKIPVQYFTMDFKSEGGNMQLFLPWPTYIIHDINEDSPLYNLSRDDAMNENFEMIVMLDAVSSSLSQAFQVRKSYYPWEIRWGHRFLPLGQTYEDIFDETVVDYENFHETKAVTTPMVSAQDIDEMSVKGDISPEKLQRRKDSRQEVDKFMRHRKSVTDTFLGAETDLSVSEMSVSVSDTLSLEKLRRISAITYHGPGTMERRKTLGSLFGSSVSVPKDRRHSTGNFLEVPSFLRGRRVSRDLSNLNLHITPKTSRERLYQPKVLDIRSETHEESGPRYLRKKRVTLNPHPITEKPVRKASDPGFPSTPLVSAMQKRRRHSTWQFTEQGAFLKEYKRQHPEVYLTTQMEVTESEESDHQESSHGGDVGEHPSIEVNNNDSERRDNQLDKTDPKDSKQDDMDETEESKTDIKKTTIRRRVVRGSFKNYIVQRVSESEVCDVGDNDEIEQTQDGNSLPTKETVSKDDSGSEDGQSEKDNSESTSEQVNLAYVYDSEDDIGYSRDIVTSDDEDAGSDKARVNQAYESDSNQQDK